MLKAVDIRAKYPNPVAAEPGVPRRDEDYCVGGAFCLSVGGREPFPKATELATRLARHNPTLGTEKAIAYADMITFHNDTGNIEQAWRELRRALMR